MSGVAALCHLEPNKNGKAHRTQVERFKSSKHPTINWYILLITK